MRPGTPPTAYPSTNPSATLPAAPDRGQRGPGAAAPRPAQRRLQGVWLGLAVGALIGCAPAATTVVDGSTPLPAHDAVLALAGPVAVEVVAGSLRSNFGCDIRYEEHRPGGGSGGPLVVLAHGFLRDLGTMRGWAAHFASREGAPVVYAGFSAGGLAALLAAAEDPGAVAYLGLDAVDSGGLAAGATRLALPALFLMAEPGACNADGNMRATAAAIASSRTVRIPNATHCDFEDPFDPLCTRLCGRVEPPSAAAAIRVAVRALATDFVRTHGGPR